MGLIKDLKLSSYDKEEIVRKEKLLENVDEVYKMRLPLIPTVIVFVIIFNALVKPFPTALTSYIAILFVTALVVPVVYLIRKIASSLSSTGISLILVLLSMIEIVTVLFIFYLWKPIITYLVGGGSIFILGLIYIIWILSIDPLFDRKLYAYFFLFLTTLCLMIFGFLEYIGIYPVYPNYPVEHLYFTGGDVALIISLFMVIIMLSIIQARFQTFWDMFRRQQKHLESLVDSLDKSAKEKTSALEDIKDVLEQLSDEGIKGVETRVAEAQKSKKENK